MVEAYGKRGCREGNTATADLMEGYVEFKGGPSSVHTRLR